jgi:hypothetical protein
MKALGSWLRWTGGLLLTAVVAGSMAEPAPTAASRELHVGLRRSSYGLRKFNDNPAWWAARARKFAADFPGAKPTLIEIVSCYQDDGSTQFGFARPAGDRGPTQGMTFSPDGIDREAALTEYDKQGIQVILQVESGHADMVRCLELLHRQFGKHPCVIGMGVDAEWFFTKESPRHEGRAITDAEARTWMAAVLALNPNYTLFLKHWDARHMPPTYRHPRLWFLSDSQKFKNAAALLADFKEWAAFFPTSATGYQFGYREDQKWWAKLPNPPSSIARQIQKQIPSTQYLFWVDFTADKVKF